MYVHAGLQHRGSAAYQARARPTRHAALHYPTPVWVREVHLSHMYDKRPKLPLILVVPWPNVMEQSMQQDQAQVQVPK